MRNRTDTPDLSWLLNLLLSPLSATFARFSPLPPLSLSRAVSLFLTLRQLYWIKGKLSCFVCVCVCACGSCAAPVTQAVCMREPDSVWSNHTNHSHGLHPSSLNPCLPTSLLISSPPPSVLPSLPPSSHASLYPSPSSPVFIPLHSYVPPSVSSSIPQSHHPTTLPPWPGETIVCWLLSLSFHCHFTVGFRQHVHCFILQDSQLQLPVSLYTMEVDDPYCNWVTFPSSPINLAWIKFVLIIPLAHHIWTSDFAHN